MCDIFRSPETCNCQVERLQGRKVEKGATTHLTAVLVRSVLACA